MILFKLIITSPIQSGMENRNLPNQHLNRDLLLPDLLDHLGQMNLALQT